MFRLLLPGIAFALLLACASPAPVATRSSPEPAPVAAKKAPPPPERAFPDDAIYPLLLAEFALRRRAYDVALEQYLALAPRLRDPGVSAHTTHLAQFMGKEQEALESVQLWVELAPEDVEANNTLSILLIRRGRAVEALPHMALLARKGEDVNFPALLSGFGQLPLDQQEALAQGIGQLVPEFPDNVRLLLTQAMVQAETEQFEAALATLNHLFELAPDQSQAAMLEARILLAQNAPRPYARIEDILARNPADKQVRLQYARLLTATDMQAAQTQFELLSAESPRDGDLLLSLALINRETGDNDAAKDYLHQLVALQQHLDEAHYYLGRIAEENEDPEGAIYEYRQVEDGREFLVAISRGSTLLIDEGRIEDNHAWFQSAREAHPERAEQLYSVEVDLLAQGGETEAAAAVLEEALAQLPDSTALLYSRAMLAEARGDLVSMEADLRAIIAAEPDNATALNALGYTLANRTDRYEEAYALVSQALALQPGEPAILDSMGWVLYRMDRNEEALDYLTRAYAAFPDPEVAAHLGEVLWVTGDTQNAMAVFQGGLLKDPGNAVLVETMERLQVTTIDVALPQDSALREDPMESEP